MLNSHLAKSPHCLFNQLSATQKERFSELFQRACFPQPPVPAGFKGGQKAMRSQFAKERKQFNEVRCGAAPVGLQFHSLISSIATNYFMLPTNRSPHPSHNAKIPSACPASYRMQQLSSHLLLLLLLLQPPRLAAPLQVRHRVLLLLLLLLLLPSPPSPPHPPLPLPLPLPPPPPPHQLLSPLAPPLLLLHPRLLHHSLLLPMVSRSPFCGFPIAPTGLQWRLCGPILA